MADGTYDPNPAPVVEQEFFILDPLSGDLYPDDYEVITSIETPLGFTPPVGGVLTDIVSFDVDENQTVFAAKIGADHFLSQEGEFSVPVGTLIQVFPEPSESSYSFPSVISNLFSKTSLQEFIDALQEFDPRGQSGELSYLVTTGVIEDESEISAIRFTTVDEFGLVNQSSDIDEFTGVVNDAPTGGSANIMQTVFYNSIAKSGGRAVVYDFEQLKSGDFTHQSFVSATSMPGIVTNQSGNIHPDGNAGASLAYDSMLNIHMFNIGNNGPVSDQSNGDDPGIATHEGNNADRGFNTTPNATVKQYLEILPSDRTSTSDDAIYGGCSF